MQVLQLPLSCVLAHNGGEEQAEFHAEKIQQQRRRQNGTSVDFGLGMGHEVLLLKHAASSEAAPPPTAIKGTELQQLFDETMVRRDKLQRMKQLDKLVLDAEAEDVAALKKSIVSKRQVAEEAMTTALRNERFGQTYTLVMVTNLSHFVDVMITKAVMLKREPGYAHLPFATRVKFCIHRCNVVPLIRWLRHNHLTLYSIAELICFAGEHLDLLRLKVEWLKGLKVRGQDLGNVLATHPELLLRPLKELNYRVGVLQNAGLTERWMGMVLTHSPQVLLESHDQLYRKFQVLTQLGIDEYQFANMAIRFPAFLGRFSAGDILEKVSFLQGLGFDMQYIGKMLAGRPGLLAQSIEGSWKHIVRLFELLGIENASLRRLFYRNPSILCLDLHIDIIPKVQLLKSVGVHDLVIGEIIVDFPPFLTMNLTRRIRPVVMFLLHTAGVNINGIGKVIGAQPEIIGCSVNFTLEQNVSFFLSLGIREQELGKMVEEFPMLIMSELSVVRPKYLYFRRVMRRHLKELISFPRFFSYPLETVIKPRNEMAVERGLSLSLSEMLACSDEQFGEKLAAVGREGEEEHN